MMSTHSDASAPLINRVTRHNNNLPEDVLLEIFDAFRQLHELQPTYDVVWNSRDGWFKLAHVCPHWRQVVFSWSSRLHVHLLFTPSRSSREPFLESLSHFPVLFDYRTESWHADEEENIGFAAIGQYRSHVRGISFRWPCQPRLLDELTSSHPFPELESVKIESYPMYEPLEIPHFLVALLSGSAPSLRRLTLRDFKLDRLFPLLPSATGLEELALTPRITPDTHPEVFLTPNLQQMTWLRRLELDFTFCDRAFPASPHPPFPASARDVVPLPSLTDFVFIGHGFYLNLLTTRLVTPSLQHLDVIYYGGDATSPLPQLCNYICDSNCQFKVVHIGLSLFDVEFSTETRFKSNHAKPAFSFSIPVPIPWEEIGQMLCGPLSTVEELVIGRIVPLGHKLVHLSQIPWGALFIHIPQVKILRVNSMLAIPVALTFQLNDQEPASALDIFPSLEQVEVQLWADGSFENIEYARFYNVFGPLIAARQQAGLPIKLSMVNMVVDGSSMVPGRVGL